MENERMTIEAIEVPEDMLMDILSRIPAKSLLRFQLVCKYWYSVIQNPNFIFLHHSRAQPYDCISTVRMHNDTYGYEFSIYLLPNQTSIQDLDLSFITPPHLKDMRLYGSCNGLMCLFNQSSIVICNPAIREFRVLPQPPYETRRTSNLGFGFDPKSNDFKVVRVATLYESDLKPSDSYDDPYDAFDKYKETKWMPVDHKIQIYGMSTNSWKEIVAMVPKDFLCSPRPCVSLDGVFYWVGFGFSTNVPTIHTLCMFEELFERIPFPEDFMADLCVLKNSLALVRQEFDHQIGGRRFDVWIADEYRVKESWTKKYAVGPLLGHYRLLGFRPNVEVILLSCHTGKMVSYKLSTGDINEYNQLCSRPVLESIVQVVSYSESLISVKIRVD